MGSRYALVAFATSRSFVIAAAVVGVLVAHPDRAGNSAHGAGLVDVGWPVDVWGNWDGEWYADIARHGYEHASSTAFFPLYPYLARMLGWLLDGHVVLASVLISLAACLGSFVLLYRLTLQLAGPEVARRAVLYLAVFPTALFLQAAYAESLLLLLALAMFILAERGRLGWASIACGLALLTRPTAVALIPALALFAWPRRGPRGAAGSLAVAAALFSLYPLALAWRHHGALSFLAAQRHWGRQFSPLGPLIAVVQSVEMTILYVERLLSPPAPSPALHAFEHAAFNNVIALCFLACFLVLLVAVKRRFGRRSPYFLYSAINLALPLFSPIPGNPLLSLPRFGLVIFPFFIVLAELTRTRPRLHFAYVAACPPLLAAASVAFVLYSWVA